MRTSNFALRLQPSLLEAARHLAESEGVALNQLINVAVAQMIAAYDAKNYLEIRARRGNIERGLDILRKAGSENPPLPGDELPAGERKRAESANLRAFKNLRKPGKGEPPRDGDELPASWKRRRKTGRKIA